MMFVVPSIAEVLINKIALCISIRANDWPAEKAIIASNGYVKVSDSQNFLLSIITSNHRQIWPHS